MASSSLVIKVNYGDTLRRFNAHIDGSGHLDMDINELRARICGFFNFSDDTDFSLTYVDEDGDRVALVDDADLYEVVTQRLKFLRIDVHLRNGNASKYCKSSGSSTPMSCPLQHTLQTINSGIAEALKSVPEPLSEALTKLSLNLATNATSTSSMFAEIVDCFSKAGQLCSKPLSLSQLNSDGKPYENPLSPRETDHVKASRDPSVPMEAAKHAGVALTSQASPKMEIGNGDGNANSPPMPTFCDFSFLDHTAADSSQPSEVAQGKKPRESDINREVKSAGLSADSTECPFGGMPLGPFPNDSPAPPLPSVVPHHIFPVKRSNKRYHTTAGVHIGVLCDGCGINPITGPRYMSKWRYNYDLCSSCFSKMGNEADYIKFVQPFKHSFPSKNIWAPGPCESSIFRRYGMKPRSKLDGRFILDVTVVDGSLMAPSTPFTKIWRMRNSGSYLWPRGTHIVWIGGDRLSNADLVELEVPADGVPIDGEFDVAVDFIAPQYPGRYTSYWRLASPTGQKFGQRVWVLIQVHASPEDIEICTDAHNLNLFVPPVNSNPKNPVDLNLSIQPVTNGVLSNTLGADSTEHTPEVDEDAKVPAPLNFGNIFDNSWGLNMDPPTGSNESKIPKTIDASVQPAFNDIYSAPDTVLSDTQPIKPMVDGKSKSFVIWDPTPSDVSGAIKYPKLSIDASTNGTNPFSSNAMCSQEVGDGNSVEDNLLKNLEEMGFVDTDLNKKILRQTDYDLEKSLNALCTIVQWEPILNELEEMGFTDKEKNVRLLRKNNGSIKLVVLDLLTGERA